MPRWVLPEGGVLGPDGRVHRPACERAPNGPDAVAVGAGLQFIRDRAPTECPRCRPELRMLLTASDGPDPLAL